MNTDLKRKLLMMLQKDLMHFRLEHFRLEQEKIPVAYVRISGLDFTNIK